MKALKPLLFVILAGLVLASAVMAEEKAAPAATPGPNMISQAKFPITVQTGEYDLQTMILEFPPGVGMSKHMHGGSVLVVVLKGEMTLIDKAGERVLKAGESWTEGPGDQHSVVNAGTTAAKVVVSVLLPKGAEPTTMIKQ
ncbi:MAG: cupin domain-containing protein [Nitrospirae bacterium]|nr:cupin domain-containing protein [Nitrospirota bacterium]